VNWKILTGDIGSGIDFDIAAEVVARIVAVCFDVHMERCRHMERNLPSAGRTVDLVEVLLAVGLAHKIDSVACTVAAEAVHHKGCNFVEEVRRKLVWVVGHHMADSLEVAQWVGRRSAQLHMGHSAAEVAYTDCLEERMSSRSSAAAGERHMADLSEAYTAAVRHMVDWVVAHREEDLRSDDMVAAEERKSFHSLVATLHTAGSAAAVPREGRQRSLDYVMAADAHHKADFAAERPLEDRLHMN